MALKSRQSVAASNRMGQHYFTKEVLTAAEAIAFSPQIWERPQVPGITIDGVESRDLDDAIWIKPEGDGLLLSVHITDVSEYVLLGSSLDREAINRTQTRYLKYGNDPMLPHVLSENRLSLLEGQPRPTITANITLDANAQIQSVEIFESWLSSLKRFSYPEVDQDLKDPHSEFHDFLNQCLEWADRLYQRRIDPALRANLNRPEGAWLDENGQWIIGAGSRYHAYLIIQEFMIVANTAIAHWLANRQLLALYRNHIPNVSDTDPKALFEILIDAGWEGDLHRQLQSGLNRAEYAVEPIGHFALKLPAYCHFTSPIRRLADLINHRVVKSHLHKQAHPYQADQLSAIATHIETVIQAQLLATKEFFKGLRHEQYERMLMEPHKVTTLEQDEFSLLLKYAATTQQIQRIEAQIRDRLAGGHLTVEDWFMILFLGSEATLQTLVLQKLEERPHDAPSIIAIAQNQMEEWGGIQYHVIGNSPFIAWLAVEMNGQHWTVTSGASHPRKQGAKHLACFVWIQSYCNEQLHRLEDVSRPAELEPVISESPPSPKPDGNSISQLNELCQKFQWPSPHYHFLEEDGFLCQCCLETPETELIGNGHGTRKAIAKQNAAQDMLTQIHNIWEI